MSIVTAAILVIGDEILSGRTKDKNIGYIAEYLTNIGIDLKEVRVVPDEEEEIVAALNALRAATPMSSPPAASARPMTTSPPTASPRHSAWRSTSIRARAASWRSASPPGLEMNEARLRMARIPAGADLIENKQSGAPGFRIGNVIVMAGVPSIMQAMLDAAAPRLQTGVKMLSETIKGDVREGDIGTELGEIARRIRTSPSAAIRSSTTRAGRTRTS